MSGAVGVSVGVPVGFSVGVSGTGPAGLCGVGGAVGFRWAGPSVTTRPMVVPSPLPPTVSPLATSKPVMTIMASTKPPNAPTITAPQRNVMSRWERLPDCGPPVLDLTGEAGHGRVRCARERTLSLLRSSEAWYKAVPTVVITLAPAAPMRVPAAPSREPSTAVVTAARAAAAMLVRLKLILRVV